MENQFCGLKLLTHDLIFNFDCGIFGIDLNYKKKKSFLNKVDGNEWKWKFAKLNRKSFQLIRVINSFFVEQFN